MASTVHFGKWEQNVGDLLYCKAESVIALKQRLVSPPLKTPEVPYLFFLWQ